MLCFAYGSNMSPARLLARVPSARYLGVASLAAHRLRFYKVGGDGSGKCFAESTGDHRDQVIGVVFTLAAGEKPVLDRVEGLGNGYDESAVEVATAEGDALIARMYVATRIDPTLKPYHWYKNHVLVGARAHGLPPGYLARIEAVESIEDLDPARCQREWAIYR